MHFRLGFGSSRDKKSAVTSSSSSAAAKEALSTMNKKIASPMASSSPMTSGSKVSSSSAQRTAGGVSIPKLPTGLPSSYRYNFDYITKGASAFFDASDSGGSKKPLRHSTSANVLAAHDEHRRSALSAPPHFAPNAKRLCRMHSNLNLRLPSLPRSPSSESLFPGSVRHGQSAPVVRPLSMLSTSSTSSSESVSSSAFSSTSSTSSITIHTSISCPDNLNGPITSRAGPVCPLHALEASALFQPVSNRLGDPLALLPSSESEQARAARMEAERQRVARWRIVAGILLARSSASARPLGWRYVSTGSVPALSTDFDEKKGRGYVKSGLSRMAVIVA